MQGLTLELRQEAPIPLDARLDCPAGALTALIGPSGAGKSTILRSIAGLYTPTAGYIRVNGKSWLDQARGLALPTHQRRVGLVFQSYALFPHMTAAGNVMAALDHLPKAERPGRASALLSLVHLDGLEGRRPAELSGGQQQRVAVARALAREPEVLLLDEPFSAVDRATREKLYQELAELRRRLAMPIVLVTHDMNEASLLADRLVLLHRGRSLQAGPPDEVMARPNDPLVARLIGQANIFDGTVIGHDREPARTWLDWGGQRLEAQHQPAFAPGSRVAWLVQPSAILLHRRGRPSMGERENPVSGRIEDLVSMGEMTRLRLRPEAPAERTINVTLPTHAARRNGLAVGAQITVSLLADGIHLMPPEPPADADETRASRPAA
jgi:molybdate transport system ATP-binding protein